MALTIDQIARISPGTASQLLGTSSATTSSSFSSAVAGQLASQQAAQILTRATAAARITAFQKTIDKAVALEREAHTLLSRQTRESPFFARTVSSADATAVTGTADALAVPRTFGITVLQVAKEQQVVSDTVGSGAAHGFGTGVAQFRITVTSTGENFDFSVDLDAQTTKLDVLNAIASQVNGAASSGVFAAVTSNATAGTSSLRIDAHSTGASSEFTLQDTAGTLLAQLNLEDSQAANPTAGTGGLLAAAADAQYKIDSGATQTSSRNAIDLFADSVRLTLIKTTNNKPITITVERDDAKISSAIESFVSTFNDLYDFSITNGGELTTPLAGALSGTFHPLISSLRDIGIDVNTNDNLLSVDTSELKTALNDGRGARVESLFLGAGGLAVTSQRISRDFLTQPLSYLTDPLNPVDPAQVQGLHHTETRGLLINILV